jgi:hypothetical protein
MVSNPKLNIRQTKQKLKESKIYFKAYHNQRNKGLEIINTQLKMFYSLKALILTFDLVNKDEVKNAFLMYKHKLEEISQGKEKADLRQKLETAVAFLCIIERNVK